MSESGKIEVSEKRYAICVGGFWGWLAGAIATWLIGGSVTCYGFGLSNGVDVLLALLWLFSVPMVLATVGTIVGVVSGNGIAITFVIAVGVIAASGVGIIVGGTVGTIAGIVSGVTVGVEVIAVVIVATITNKPCFSLMAYAATLLFVFCFGMLSSTKADNLDKLQLDQRLLSQAKLTGGKLVMESSRKSDFFQYWLFYRLKVKAKADAKVGQDKGVKVVSLFSLAYQRTVNQEYNSKSRKTVNHYCWQFTLPSELANQSELILLADRIWRDSELTLKNQEPVPKAPAGEEPPEEK